MEKKLLIPAAIKRKPRKCVNGNTVKGNPSDEQQYPGGFGGLFYEPSAPRSLLIAVPGSSP